MNVEWTNPYDKLENDEARIQQAEDRFHAGATMQVVDMMLAQIEERVWADEDQAAVANLWMGLMTVKYDLGWLWNSFGSPDVSATCPACNHSDHAGRVCEVVVEPDGERCFCDATEESAWLADESFQDWGPAERAWHEGGENFHDNFGGM